MSMDQLALSPSTMEDILQIMKSAHRKGVAQGINSVSSDTKSDDSTISGQPKARVCEIEAQIGIMTSYKDVMGPESTSIVWKMFSVLTLHTVQL